MGDSPDVNAVMEFGVGTGHATPNLLMDLARNKTHRPRYVATEFSDTMMDKLRAQNWYKERTDRFPGIDIETRGNVDMNHLHSATPQLKDGEFDRVLASMVMIPAEQGLSQVHRVLKPGGLFGFSAFGSPEIGVGAVDAADSILASIL